MKKPNYKLTIKTCPCCGKMFAAKVRQTFCSKGCCRQYQNIINRKPYEPSASANAVSTQKEPPGASMKRIKRICKEADVKGKSYGKLQMERMI